jgi:hypothetical protein
MQSSMLLVWSRHKHAPLWSLCCSHSCLQPKYEHFLLLHKSLLFPLASLPEGVDGVAILGFGTLSGTSLLICLRSSAIDGFSVPLLLAAVEGTPSIARRNA